MLIEVVRKIVDQIMEGKSRDIAPLMGKDLKIESPVISYISPKSSPVETLVELIQYWKRAFPDVVSEWKRVDEKEGGEVCVHWSAQATHKGSTFMDVEPQGVTLTYEGVTTYTFEDGLLVKYHSEIDVDAIKEHLRV